MSAQWSPKVKKILEGCACGDLKCQCAANLSNPSGFTHCPSCNQVRLAFEEINGKVTPVPKCGCDAGEVTAALIQRGFEL
jgi:hypothetical protein